MKKLTRRQRGTEEKSKKKLTRRHKGAKEEEKKLTQRTRRVGRSFQVLYYKAMDEEEAHTKAERRKGRRKEAHAEDAEGGAQLSSAARSIRILYLNSDGWARLVNTELLSAIFAFSA